MARTDTVGKSKPKKRASRRAVDEENAQVLVSSADQDAYLDALMTVMMNNKETRKELANNSIELFSQYYFGIRLGKHQSVWSGALEKRQKGLVLAPCGHGKTELFSKQKTIHTVCRNRNIRILLCSKSDGLAVKNLKSVRWEFENNAKLIEDYGEFKTTSETWSDHQLYCRRDKNMKDPTIEAVGLLGAITGGRFDVIMLDDVLDVLNCASELQREKIKDYINGTLITRLEPWGVVWAIGTRKHPDDYYQHCIDNKGWYVHHDKAIVREPDDYEIVESDEPMLVDDGFGNITEVNVKAVIKGEDHGEVLWPDKWRMEPLLALRYTIGNHTFNREYQNIISSDETALFKWKWMRQCRDFDFSYVKGNFFDEWARKEYDAIIQGTDPSLVDDRKKAESGDTDYSVVITLGVKAGQRVDLLGLKRMRGASPGEIERMIEEEYLRFRPDFHFLESNSFGTIYAHNLIQGKGYSFVKHHTDRKKHDLYTGVPGMAVLFENGHVRLPYATPEDREITDRLITEFHGLTIEKHDDIVMAFWIAHTGVQRFRTGLARISRNRNVKRVKRAKRA